MTQIFGALRHHYEYENIFFGYYWFFITLPIISSHNYTTTNTCEGLELENVCETPNTQIQHLCKYKCYTIVSKDRKTLCSIFNKTKHMIKLTIMWSAWENFRLSKPLCSKASLMTQFTNLDIEKNLPYILTSNKMLVISKWSRNTLINIALLNMYWKWAMTSYLCSISFA